MIYNTEILREIRDFATRAHQGQYRKSPHEPYINHPIRVMKICADYTTEISILGAALLHDILEDTRITREQLNHYLNTLTIQDEGQKMLGLIDEMTDIYTKDKYPQWNRHQRKTMERKRIIQTSGDSQTLRYADIIDNCKGLDRLETEFSQLFLNECFDLLQVITKGNKDLYDQTISIVHDNLNDMNKNKNR